MGSTQQRWVLLPPVPPPQLWQCPVAASLRKSKTHLLGLLSNAVHFVVSLADAEMETTPVATPVPRGTSLSCDTSVKPPVQESKLPEGEMASSTPSMLTKEKVGDFSPCHLHFILANCPWPGDFLLQRKILSWWQVYSGLFFSPLHSSPRQDAVFWSMGEGSQGLVGFDSLFPLLDLPVSLLASRCLFPPLSSLLVSLPSLIFPESQRLPRAPTSPCPAHSPSAGSCL